MIPTIICWAVRYFATAVLFTGSVHVMLIVSEVHPIAGIVLYEPVPFVVSKNAVVNGVEIGVCR